MFEATVAIEPARIASADSRLTASSWNLISGQGRRATIRALIVGIAIQSVVIHGSSRIARDERKRNKEILT